MTRHTFRSREQMQTASPRRRTMAEPGIACALSDIIGSASDRRAA